jgi:hypothetical protein
MLDWRSVQWFIVYIGTVFWYSSRSGTESFNHCFGSIDCRISCFSPRYSSFITTYHNYESNLPQEPLRDHQSYSLAYCYRDNSTACLCFNLPDIYAHSYTSVAHTMVCWWVLEWVLAWTHQWSVVKNKIGRINYPSTNLSISISFFQLRMGGLYNPTTNLSQWTVPSNHNAYGTWI